MNIYFACSITGGREFESVYQDLTAAMLADGHEVPTAHLAHPEIMSAEAVIEPGEVHTFIASSLDYYHFVLHCPPVKGDKVVVP